MLLEVTKESFHNKSDKKTKFKLERMWHTLRHQPKWYVKHDIDASSDES
jgi:hypothetical protein